MDWSKWRPLNIRISPGNNRGQCHNPRNRIVCNRTRHRPETHSIHPQRVRSVLDPNDPPAVSGGMMTLAQREWVSDQACRRIRRASTRNQICYWNVRLASYERCASSSTPVISALNRRASHYAIFTARNCRRPRASQRNQLAHSGSYQ